MVQLAVPGSGSDRTTEGRFQLGKRVADKGPRVYFRLSVAQIVY